MLLKDANTRKEKKKKKKKGFESSICIPSVRAPRTLTEHVHQTFFDEDQDR